MEVQVSNANKSIRSTLLPLPEIVRKCVLHILKPHDVGLTTQHPIFIMEPPDESIIAPGPSNLSQRFSRPDCIKP